MAGKGHRLGKPHPPSTETLRDISDEALLQRVGETLARLVGDDEAAGAVRVAEGLLRQDDLDLDGIRAMLYQITRNRDPDMQANHLTEMRVAAAVSGAGGGAPGSGATGRHVDIERMASGRNEKRVDFALDEPDGTILVEVKNLNPPMFKKATDPQSETLRLALRGTASRSDLHMLYLFFRRPRPDEMPRLESELRERWAALEGRLPQLLFVPRHRPRIAALAVPARPDSGGRVIVYDHGQHLWDVAGARIRVVHKVRPAQRRPRERIEEIFLKDNILRRLQDSESKFPLDSADAPARVVVFCQGGWAPVAHVDRCLDEAVHWYLTGRAREDDVWSGYYEHWAQRWTFTALHNVDAIVAMRPHHPAASGLRVSGGDLDFSVRTVYCRRQGLVERVFQSSGDSRRDEFPRC